MVAQTVSTLAMGAGPRKAQLERTIGALRAKTCQVCYKIFTQKSDLNRHIKSVHQGEKPYPCADCGKDFSQKVHLIQHMRCVHKGEKPHICPECGKSFGDRCNLTRHIRGVHGGVHQ